jgi:hypothetical protein
MSNIEVIAMRRVSAGSIRAFLDLRLGDEQRHVVIRDCKIVESAGKPAWLAMPSTKSGNRWVAVCELSKELRKRVEAIALTEWRNQGAADSARFEGPGAPVLAAAGRGAAPLTVEPIPEDGDPECPF